MCASRRKPSGKQTVGVLQRRHVYMDQIRCIGKEANRLEEVESGMIHSAQNVYTEYPDPQRDEWMTKIVPTLRRIPLSQIETLTHLSRRAIINARNGRTRP